MSQVNTFVNMFINSPYIVFVRDGVNPDTNKVSHVTIQITNKHDMFRHMLVTGNVWDRKYNKNRLGVS